MIAATSLPFPPKDFTEAVLSLAEQDVFDVCLTEQDEREIYQQIVEHPIKYGYPCGSFLEWRDAVYDAMVDLNYELND